MKNKHLKWGHFAVAPPKINSRRLGLRQFVNVAYKTDGGGGDDNDTPEAQLLEKIKAKVATELKERNYQNGTEVQTMITATLKGLNLEALRKFDDKFDPAAVQESVRSLASELEKLKNRPTGGNPANQQRAAALKALLEDKKTMDLIERAFTTRNPGDQVRLECRAAIGMTSQNVVNDGDIPEDILNSFSVDVFVKKRRPTEFIWEIVNRRTIPKITEYKTWLEEGTEDGAFAIVSEGAVKPLVSKTLVRNTTKYRKLAGKRVYTEEFAKFRQEAYTILEDLFNDQLLRNYNAVLVTSLNTWAAAYVGTVLDGQYIAPTDYHAIGAVAAQIESLDFIPDLLIMNPQDKWRIGLEQTTQGQFYVNVPMYNPSGQVTMMGFRVFTSNRVAAGSFYLGEAGLYKVEDEPVTIRLGYGIDVTITDGVVTSVTSDVDNNRFRIIAETYFHNYVGTNYTGSWVKAVFADVKTALLKPEA